MTGVRLLLVPYELARPRIGVGRGPERLLELGAEKALAGSGARVEAEVIELDGDFSELSGGNEVDASFDLIRLVAGRVRAAIDEGDFPVLLSGSCFLAAVGAVAGVSERSLGVVWLDAHADFNSPETTIEGYIDGMGLAMLTGGAWQGMLGAVGGFRPLAETAAVLVGARDFDEPEKARLDDSTVNWLPPAEARSADAVWDAVSAMRPEPTGVYLHVDLDVLDAGEAPVNIYSAPDGLDASQLGAVVGSLMEASPVRALSLTAYDPECDPEDLVPPIALGLLELAAEAIAAAD